LAFLAGQSSAEKFAGIVDTINLEFKVGAGNNASAGETFDNRLLVLMAGSAKMPMGTVPTGYSAEKVAPIRWHRSAGNREQRSRDYFSWPRVASGDAGRGPFRQHLPESA
jgi:hypothetical protein